MSTTDLLHIAPWAALSCLVSISLLWLLLRVLKDRPFWSLAVLVAVPLLSALGFVVAISGFMFTPQLGWTLVTCLLIGVMPGSSSPAACSRWRPGGRRSAHATRCGASWSPG